MAIPRTRKIIATTEAAMIIIRFLILPLGFGSDRTISPVFGKTAVGALGNELGEIVLVKGLMEPGLIDRGGNGDEN